MPKQSESSQAETGTTLGEPPWSPAVGRVKERLAALRARADGTILTKVSGPHFVVITKEGAELRLWLMEQGRPSTGVVQSEIDLGAPTALLEGYTQAMTLALLWNPTPERAFFSGLGGGRVPLVMHTLLPHIHIWAAEIDAEIIAVAKSHFGLPIGDRVSVDLADGRVWLEEHSDQSFDIIVVDVFLDNGYTPYRQSTTEFFTLCRARLQPEGVLVVNLLENDRFTPRKLATLAGVFRNVFTVSIDQENTIVFATDSDTVEPASARALAQSLDRDWRLPFPFVELAARLSADHSRFAEHLDALAPLSDDDAPPGYFDALPALAGPFGKTNAAAPCPCGSGKLYGLCHGLAPG